MEPKRYHLDTIVAVTLAKLRKGEKRLEWRETKLVDGQSVWFSQEDVFKIHRSEESPDNPFNLYVTVLGDQEAAKADHQCRIGPFHSLGAAQEAAERIFSGLMEGKVHRSQFRGAGFVAVASRVVFPNL
jgi:hypothetical protein